MGLLVLCGENGETSSRYARCSHFGAEQVSTTEGKQLSDGRWMYWTAYHCPDCGARFSETHVQAVAVR